MPFTGAVKLWEQHSGIPARMLVENCSGGKNKTCWGVQPDGIPVTVDDPSHPGRTTIQIQDADSGDIGHEVDVHVHYTHRGQGTFAIKDGFVLDLYFIGVGCAAAIGAVIAVGLRLRRRRENPTNRPRLGPTEFLPPQ
jgi:hypothetical protein